MKYFRSSFLLTALTAGSIGLAHGNPAELDISVYSNSSLTPSPACLSAHADGSVFVGVDMLGSLGKGAGKGKIIKLIDSDNDGKVDKHSEFAKIDNPRGLIAMGDKLYVLHTVIPADTQILEAMHLSVLTDADQDGIADGPPKHLIENISVPKHNQDRGADHTTNGIRMGIDGWIYIAVGDFGFVDAKGTDGKKLTMLGGGVLRVRPDGSEMEVYTHGLRNIYDIAIDPYMNIFTRGNTNDGGGWNVRFIHHVQTGEYGYPILFKFFTDEIIPALADLGGGSGTGSYFLQEPGWPEKFNNVPLMCDWGNSHTFIHRLTADGPSFTQKPEHFIQSSQPTDIDADGSGRLYLADWAGAGYKGSPNNGDVKLIKPKGWTYKPFPKLPDLHREGLVHLIQGNSATARLNAQQELLRRGDKSAAQLLLALAKDSSSPHASRVAAIFTYAQLLEAKATEGLLSLLSDGTVREFAIRAMADRLPTASTLSPEPIIKFLQDNSPRVQVAAAVALGRIGKIDTAKALLAVAKPPVSAQTAKGLPIYSSQVIKGTETVEIDLDITGFKELYLHVQDGGDGNGFDHAAWDNPVLIDAAGNKTPLTQLNWKSATHGWGATVKNKSCTNLPLKRADGTAISQGIGTHAASTIAYDLPSPFVRFQATGSLGDTVEKGAGSIKFIVSPTSSPDSSANEGPHATPNSAVILPHVAVHALVNLNASDACLAAIDSPSQDGALWALRLMHEDKVVDGLISQLKACKDQTLRAKLLTALARLYTKEAPYDGSWWWQTRPDTRGPYYVPVTWSSSPKIKDLFLETYQQGDAQLRDLLTMIANKHRMNIPGLSEVEVKETSADPKVADTSIEDIMLSFDKHKGDLARGKELLKKQACIGCHSIEETDAKKGPDLNKIGSILNREKIAEAILKPDATIAANWVDVTTNDGTVTQGTLISRDDKQVTLRNIAGVSTNIPAADVKSVKAASSTLMGPHLLDALTLDEFADVVDYLHSKK